VQQLLELEKIFVLLLVCSYNLTTILFIFVGNILIHTID
jgi:hypothetical protein